MAAPTWERLGEETWILRHPVADPWVLAQLWNENPVPGMLEAFPAIASIGIRIDPDSFAGPDTLPLVGALPSKGRVVHVPVCYELGEDLVAVADQLSLAPEDVVRLHSFAEYRCVAIGFCPGFPYLTGLAPELSGIGRRATPRTRVEAGSVAVAAGQSGIYTMARPGGWAILGRTPRVCVDPADDFFPIHPGDTVKFEPMSVQEFDRQRGSRL